jgi:hypothetical protein
MTNPLDAIGSTVGITDLRYLIHRVHHISLITGDSGCPPVFTGDLCWSGHKTPRTRVFFPSPCPLLTPPNSLCGPKVLKIFHAIQE